MSRGNLLTVARREFRGFTDQPTAYVLAVAFLGLSLFLTFRSMYANGVATLRPLFDLLPILFAVFIPAVTMRSVAEEKRGRTLDWLLAQPLRGSDVVVGKFLGNWMFVLLTLAGTLPTALGLLVVSDADPGIVVAQYVGASLLAAQFVAIGLWASSLTRNQITAFIVAALACFLLVLIGLPIVQIGLPPLLSGVLARLSVVSHFENVARGVIDLRDVLYFLSTAALFLALAGATIARDRLSPFRADWGRLRLGILLAATIVVTLNLLGAHIRGRLDLTRGNLFTLSAGSREILGGLDDVVQVTLYASSELPPEVQIQLRDVRDLLADMRRASDGELRVRDVDPDRDEETTREASSHGIRPVEFNVLRDDEFQIRRGYYGLVVEYAGESEVFPVIQRTDDLEFRLASAIETLTSAERAPLVFLTDGNAMGAARMPGLREALGDRYDLRSMTLAADTTGGLDSARVAVLAGPSVPLDSAAVEGLRHFVAEGGNALLLLDPVTIDPQNPQPVPVRTGLEGWLTELGIGTSASMVADLASAERVSLGQRGLFNVVAPYPLWPVARPSGDHLVTRGLSALTLAWAGALEITDTAAVTPLWETSPETGIRGPGLPIMPDQEWSIPEADRASRVVAAALGAGAEPGGDGRGRLVVVADADFGSGQFIQSSPQNLAFLANAVDWLAQDEALIAIRSKDRTPPELVLTSDFARNALKWGNLAGVPALFALTGVWWVTGRRRRARARWQEVVQ